ncbi:MAG: clpC, partial [Ilumatobacteraceae bacterium]|nr:clpC [Ilumatobacteraceae bacterium]
LNRIDEVIVFHELSKEEVVEIVDFMIQRVSNQLELQGLSLVLTPPAKLLLAERGYDPQLGARPLRRAIQRMIEDALSEKILYKQFNAGEIIVVDTEEDPDKPGEKRLTFNAVPGFMPPAAVELAATGVEGDTTPVAE